MDEMDGVCPGESFFTAKVLFAMIGRESGEMRRKA